MLNTAKKALIILGIVGISCSTFSCQENVAPTKNLKKALPEKMINEPEDSRGNPR